MSNLTALPHLKLFPRSPAVHGDAEFGLIESAAGPQLAVLALGRVRRRCASLRANVLSSTGKLCCSAR